MEQKFVEIPESFKNLVGRAYGFKSYTDIMSIEDILIVNAEINRRLQKEGAKHYPLTFKLAETFNLRFELLPEDNDLITPGFGDHFAMHVEETPDRYTIRMEKEYSGFLDEKGVSGFLDFPAKILAVKKLAIVTWFLKQGTPTHLLIAKRLMEIIHAK